MANETDEYVVTFSSSFILGDAEYLICDICGSRAKHLTRLSKDYPNNQDVHACSTCVREYFSEHI